MIERFGKKNNLKSKPLEAACAGTVIIHTSDSLIANLIELVIRIGHIERL